MGDKFDDKVVPPFSHQAKTTRQGATAGEPAGKPVTRSAITSINGNTKQRVAAKPLKRIVRAVANKVGAAASAVKGLARRAVARTKTVHKTPTKRSGKTAVKKTTVAQTTVAQTTVAQTTVAQTAVAQTTVAQTTTNKMSATTKRATTKITTAKTTGIKMVTRSIQGRDRVTAIRRKQRHPTSTIDTSEPVVQVDNACCKRRRPATTLDMSAFKKSRYDSNLKEPVQLIRLHSVLSLSEITGMPSKSKRTPTSTPSAETTPVAPTMVTRGNVGKVMKKRKYDDSDETGKSVTETRSNAEAAANHDHNPKRRRTSKKEQDGTGSEAIKLVDMPENVVDYGSGSAPLVDTTGIEKKPRSARSRREIPPKKDTDRVDGMKHLDGQLPEPCTSNVQQPVAETIDPVLILAVDLEFMFNSGTCDSSRAQPLGDSSDGANLSFDGQLQL